MKPDFENTPSTVDTSPEDRPPEGEPKSTNKKKLIIITLVVLVAVGGGFAAAFLLGNNNRPATAPSEQPATEDPFAQQYLRGCKKDRNVTFTHAPVPLDQLGYIEPMGKMSDGHVTPTDHVYIAPKNPSAADNTTDVVMPADGTIIGVSAMPAQYIGDKDQQTAAEDHRLIVAHNCQYVSIFIHVHKLSEALRVALGGPLQPNTQKEITLDMKAGDKLGTIGGNPVDWSLMDATKKLSGFVTPDLYRQEPWKIHVIDPLSVYTGTTKEQLIAKSLRSQEPYGGKIDYDKKGALIGNWFREGTNGYAGADPQRYWDGHLAIVPNHIDPNATVFSIGNWQGKAAQFAVKGNVDPASITPSSGVTKYELGDVSYVTPNGQDWVGRDFAKGLALRTNTQVKGTTLLQILEGEKLKVEIFPGKTAAEVSDFTSAAQTYTR